MDRLRQTEGLQIRQRREMIEVFTGFETKNQYEVRTPAGEPLYHAAEESGFLGRNVLNSARPFQIHVADSTGTEVLLFRRPFTFYWHHVDVYDAAGAALGTVVRRFSLLRRLYTLRDAAGQPVLELFGPLLHPWTFHVRRGAEQIGKITKRWSGLGTEAFTDADTFGVTWPAELDLSLKALLLGAVFLIDFMYFERGSD